MSDSHELVDFVVGLVDFIGQVKVWVICMYEEINLTLRTCENFFGLAKMTSRLVHPGNSLPKGQTGQLNFFVP